jgi:hypothetical protein
MKIISILCLLFFLNVHSLRGMELEHEEKMDIIEAVVRSLIFGRPPAYPKHPTHFAFTFPEGVDLEELRARIPDSPLPLISEDAVDFHIRPCRMKNSGEQVSPRSINFNPPYNQNSTIFFTDNDIVKVLVVDGDKCFSDGKGYWFFLSKTFGNWQIVKIKPGGEFD